MDLKAIVESVIKWVRGILLDPNPTAAEYRANNTPWKTTLIELTIPLTVVSYVVAYILAWFTGGALAFGAMASVPLWAIVAMAWSIAFLLLAAFVFDYFAGMFGGTRSYDQAVALATLAMIPSTLGSIVSPVPWIGWLLSLIATIYGLVLLYRFVPVFLAVPEPSRVKHFVVAFVTCLVINLVVATVIGGAIAGSVMMSAYSDAADSSDSGNTVGFGSGFERQAEVMEGAQNDTYDPPADGRLDEEQVQAFVSAMKKTAALRERLSKKYEGKEEPGSLGDLVGGVGDIMRLTSAEMEVVKGAGGNWAEHLWVKQAIETARVQQDINDAVAHNYALYLDYQGDIDALD
ncbi:MAG: YIP1 family protein [Gammaproteobacteria bacterium]|nr:YIP1 family protein [Gammaproteobacteria bacterium]